PALGCALLLTIGCGGDEAATDGNSGGNAGAAGSGGQPNCQGAPPAPNSFTPMTGPGGPTNRFDAAPAATPCAFLDGGENDPDHHNGVFMLDGYLVMPWAPEWADGGISIYDFSNSCAPRQLNTVDAVAMRETHAAG